jgi:L-ascorbate metabolism protein UlaG (beta-lactamase superfamily)
MWGALLDAAMRGLNAPDPRWFHMAEVPCEHDVELTYLGTAGFMLRGPGRVLALDPYVTRASAASLLGGPLVPDRALIARLFPEVDDVLVGHAHYDHVLDAPLICQQTGARLIGSRATCMVGRAAGLPERQLLATAGREDLESGPWSVRGLPSRHGKVFMGRVPFPGDITAPPAWPPRFTQLRHGLVLNWLVRCGKLTLVHVDSADYVREELEGLRADVVCLCAVGRHYRPRYVEEIVHTLRPRWVVPCHWDTMMTHIDDTPKLIPGVDLPGFIDEIRRAGAEPLPLPFFGRVLF